MKLNFLVAPDFSPDRFAGWHMLNTLLQTRSGLHLHLITPDGAQQQTALIKAGQVDLIYANPFDASALMREKDFKAFARPKGKPDEMVIAVGAESIILTIEDLKPGCKIAMTDHRDVKLIGLRLLEAADLTEADVNWVVVETHQAAARLAMKGEVDASFFLAETFHSLSRITKNQLKVLIESAIDDISHVFLAHPKIADQIPFISSALTQVGHQTTDSDVLEALGIPRGFELMLQEDAEFMVDLMDTLLD